MALMKEVSFIFDLHLPKPEVFCKVFEDNKSCIDVAKSNKLSPRTKHIAIKYHRFRSFIQNNIIRICCIDTREQTSDIFTEPLDKALFIYLRRKWSRWWLKKWNLCFEKVSLIIQITNQTHNYHNLFDLSSSFCFKIPHKRF